MHVHTAEGSMDGKVSIFDTVDRLKMLGFDGMLVTDHNSYKGYDAWVASGREDFVVIKGIEYDTADAGHILVIVPDNMNTEIFTLQGLKISTLIDIVHKMNGVLGPAHPYEYERLGIGNNPRWFNRIDIFNQFDFIEGFNSCCGEMGNFLAQATAKRFKKPYTAGSDSHRFDCIGMARTIFNVDVYSTTDLILAIKSNEIGAAVGDYFESSLVKHRRAFSIGLYGFYAFNKAMSLMKAHKRNSELIELMGK